MSGTSAPTLKDRPRRHRHLRGLAGVSLVALVLVLVVAAAASWHFASAVLVPHHGELPVDVTVNAVLADQIVLPRSGATLRPGVYGLDWQAGHAILGAILKSDAHTVTRQLSAVHGYLTAGIKVALDNEVYVGDPGGSLGLPFSTVAVPDELGPMPAWMIPGHGDTWAIVVHGINRDRQAGLDIAPTLHRAGLPTMLISYRGDLGAPSGSDGLHHMGLSEWRDLAAAASYALSHGARRLLLVGYSMGGAVVAQFMQRSPLAARAAGLVLDAPALDWKAILSFNASQLGLPAFAAAPVEWAIGARIDANWNSLDALRHPSDFQLPILLFHGTADRLVPISTSDAFAKELPGRVTYYRVALAAHVEAWNVNPGLYEQRVSAFLTRIGAGR